MPLLPWLTSLLSCTSAPTVSAPRPAPTIEALGRLPGGALHAFDLSADGRSVAVGSQEGVSVFDAESGAERWFAATDRWVLDVSLSADGGRVAAGLDGGGALVWTVGEDAPITRLDLGKSASDLMLSPDGRTLATAIWTNQAQLWDVATGQAGLALDSEEDVRALAFRPDGGALAVLGKGGGLRVFTLDGKALAQMKATGQGALAVVWSPDGAGLAVVQARGVERWTAAGQAAPALSLDSGVGRAIAWGADGRISVGTDTGAVQSWAADGESSRFAADGDEVVGLADSGGDLWVAGAGIGRWRDGARRGGLAFAGSPQLAAFSEGGDLALAGGATVSLWRALSGLGSVAFQDPGGHLTGLAWRGDGAVLYGGSSKEINAWTATDLRPRFSVQAGPREQLFGPAASAAGIAFVRARAGGLDDQGRALQAGWSVALLDGDGAALHTTDETQTSGRPEAIRWGADGAALAVGINGAATVLKADLSAQSQRPRLASGELSVAWAGPRLLSVASDKRGLALWEPGSGRDTRTLQVDISAAGVALLATSAAEDVAAFAVNAADGAQVAVVDLGRGLSRYSKLPEAGRTALSLALSPDGGLLAAGFHDAENQGSLVLWDLSTGAVLLRQDWPQGPVSLVAFSPDGGTLLAGGRGGVRLWRVGGTAR